MPNPTPEGAGMSPLQANQALIQMATLAVTETSTDGMVRVSVDAQGLPTELTLTNRAWGADPARLSAELMTCLRRAQGTLAAQVQDLVVASVPGREDDAAAQVVASYRDRFGRLSKDRPARHARRSDPPEDDLEEIQR